MGKQTVKKPAYDGKACILYDYIVTQGLTEETVVELIGIETKGGIPCLL